MVFLQKAFFKLRFYHLKKLISRLRGLWYKLQGMKVGAQTNMPKVNVTWPHQVSIGDKCLLEHHIYFKYDGIWQHGPSIRIGNRVFIGSDCEFNITSGIIVGDETLIASGCRFIDHDHGMAVGQLMREQTTIEQPITIGDDVWLGCNVVVLKGVTIGNGAVVAAGAVVNKSIGPMEIWGGVPAKKIGERK